MNNQFNTATLAGGCFWCLEAIYVELQGVSNVKSGYSGGNGANPDYKLVTTGATGHAEVVQITFDPTVITYKELLQIFFTIHDPTTINRQGADIGTIYRSAIYYNDENQRLIAVEVIRDIETAGIWAHPIVTEVTAFDRFYIAEDYHQEYFANNGNQPYCRAVISPKLAKFRKQFQTRLK